jgi:ribosomal protein L14E/L6E/L27E
MRRGEPLGNVVVTVTGVAKGGEASMTSIRDDRLVTGDIPSQRTAADAYRVSDDQLHRARMVVARNSDDPEDLRRLLDMLGLISANPDQPPPVVR